MARTVTAYVSPYMNLMASAFPTAIGAPVSGAPIYGGINIGAFIEVSDGNAKALSAPTGLRLYAGTYAWVQLDPAVTGTVPVGSALFWLQSADPTLWVVTTVAAGNSPDLAGVSIDPNFGQSAPYAYMQINGKANVLYNTSPATAYGNNVVLTSLTTTTFSDGGAATTAQTGLYVGNALAVGTASTTGLVRLKIPIART